MRKADTMQNGNKKYRRAPLNQGRQLTHQVVSTERSLGQLCTAARFLRFCCIDWVAKFIDGRGAANTASAAVHRHCIEVLIDGLCRNSQQPSSGAVRVWSVSALLQHGAAIYVIIGSVHSGKNESVGPICQ